MENRLSAPDDVVTLQMAVTSTDIPINDLLMCAGDQYSTLRLLCLVDYKDIWPETECIPDTPSLNDKRDLFAIPWYYMSDLIHKNKTARVATFQFPQGRASFPGALNVRLLLGGSDEFTLQEPYTIALPDDLENLFFYKDEIEKITNIVVTTSSPVQQPGQGNGKKSLAEIEETAKQIMRAENDLDVVAALLCDTYGAKQYQVTVVLNIAPHLKNNMKSRDRETSRAVKRGRKKLLERKK